MVTNFFSTTRLGKGQFSQMVDLVTYYISQSIVLYAILGTKVIGWIFICLVDLLGVTMRFLFYIRDKK